MAVPTRINAVTAMLSIFLGLLALVGSANSAPSSPSSSSSSSPSSTSSAAAVTHTVSVGLNGFTYTPNSFTANVGDTVLYFFYPSNHSVARAEYGYPCIPYENTGPNKEGFWSGFEPVDKISENAPRFSVTINSTEPIFFYCSAPNACIGDGMIGVINPNNTQSLANQQAFLRNATIQLNPGEQNPPESTPTSTPTPSSTAAASSSSSSSGMSGGVIAGIVIGAIAVLALAGLAFYLCGRNRTLASVLRYSQPPRARPQNIPPIPYSPPPVHSPYSPEFSTKQCQGSPSPGLNEHDSWQTHSTTQPLQPTSPEMAAAGGMMSPQLFNPGYGNSGYNAVENTGNNPVTYQGHPSPGSASSQQHGGHNQVQYAQVPNEMSTGHEPLASPGQLSYMSQQSQQSQQSHQTQPVQEVHELDARSAVPESPGAPPPQYAHRTFSFSEGTDAPPGVEKVLRE
jgi:plastocyanin